MQPAAASGSAGAGQPRRLSFNGLDGHRRRRARAAAVAKKGFAFMVGCAQAKEFALAHWLVNGAERSRLFVRCIDGAGTVRENAAGDVLVSLTTMVWNAPSKSWTGSGTMADASLNRRMTVRLADGVAFAQIGTVGPDKQIEREAMRLNGLP
jgi:hypothetical protein